VSGPRVPRDFGVHAVQLPHGVRREHGVGGAARQHATISDQHEVPAQSGGEIRSWVDSTIVTAWSRFSVRNKTWTSI
jgi:hypothetical protein